MTTAPSTAMLERIPDLGLFLRFVELDGSTEGKNPEPLEWFRDELTPTRRPASAPALAAAPRLRRTPGRGSRGRHLAGRFARDDVADRSTCDVRDAAASHLRHAFRSQGKGTRGA